MKEIEKKIESLIFWSRWLQLPMYIGLIIALLLYIITFLKELINLFMIVLYAKESIVMLSILTLIDIVMVSSLLIMVIIGGYSIFVSKLDLQNHEDKPGWLDHIDAGILKVKIAGALATVSGIHLLKSFIHLDSFDSKTIKAQMIIHVIFILSTIALAFTEKMLKNKDPH